jgi:hypothetical protein
MKTKTNVRAGQNDAIESVYSLLHDLKDPINP